MCKRGNDANSRVFALSYCSLLPVLATALSEEVFPHQPEVVLSVLHVQSGGIFRSAMTYGRSLCCLERHNIPQDTISTSTAWCEPIRTGHNTYCWQLHFFLPSDWSFTPRRPNPPRDPDQATGAFDVETRLMADESDEHFWVDVWLFLKQVLHFFWIAIWLFRLFTFSWF